MVRRRPAALLVGLCLSAACPADDTPPSDVPGATAMLEEIVVTSRRRPEDLGRIPVAVTALTGDELLLRQIDSADRLGDFVPNLVFDKAAPAAGSASAGQIFLRGIGQTDFTPVTDPGVALYVDGVYLARSPGNVLDLIDIERVEVLRGPQGTLFGRNSIGGAIKVHSVRPDRSAASASVEARIGSDALNVLALKGNVPLGDALAFNLSAFGQRRDGYVRRAADDLDTGDRNRWAVRGSLRWDVAPTLEVLLAADYSSIDENGAPTVSGGVNDMMAFGRFGNALLATCPGIVINPGFDGTPAGGPPSFPPPGVPAPTPAGCYGAGTTAGPYVSEGSVPVYSRLETEGLLVEADWRVHPDVLVESTSGFRRMSMQSSRDADNTPANIFATRDDYEHEQLTQEFRVHYRRERLQALGGLFFLDESGFNLVDVTVPTGAILSGGYYDNRSLAAFAHASVELGERLELSAGARHTIDEKSYLPDQISLGDASAGGAPGLFEPTWPELAGVYLAPSGPLPRGERLLDFSVSELDFDATDVTVSLSLDVTAGLMAYASYATGYKSGGFDQRFVGPTPDRLPTSYSPETVDSIELGAKFSSGRIRLSAAVFDADYDDLQIIVRESFNPLTVNAGAARVRGAEFELAWVSGRAWEADLSLSYLDAAYENLSDAAIATGVRLDNQFVNAPRRSAAFGLAHRLPDNRVGALTLRADWIWSDEQFHDAVNSPSIRQGPQGLLNAVVRFESADQRWVATLSGRNLLDEAFLITGNSAFDTAAAYVEQVFDRGRDVQLSIKYRL